MFRMASIADALKGFVATCKRNNCPFTFFDSFHFTTQQFRFRFSSTFLQNKQVSGWRSSRNTTKEQKGKKQKIHFFRKHDFFPILMV